MKVLARIAAISGMLIGVLQVFSMLVSFDGSIQYMLTDTTGATLVAVIAMMLMGALETVFYLVAGVFFWRMASRV